MGRKQLLEGLFTPGEEPVSGTPPVTARKSTGRGVGLVGAMTETVESIQSDLRQAQDDLRQAQEKVEGGELIIEIETDLIDPSFVADRLDDDAAMDSFITSIREQGQRTPILVRPHPDAPGRYQIAFGHRRYRALKLIGRPVRAMVKPLSDEELVVAQGQENQDRLDLSYIERALFAARLEAGNFARDVICVAMNIDKTEVSRMIKLATTVPDDLIRVIGPAQTTGRRRWMELAAALEQTDWSAERDGILDLCRKEGATDSDARFDLVLKKLSSPIRPAPSGPAAPSQPSKGGAPSFKVDRKAGVIRIRFDEANLPEDVLDDLMSRVRDVCDQFGAKT
ncbi:MAG: plasmid partitioning protein RepB [Rhodospirillales bacterium]|nr:plasmid partitioning protein RepB [Rhodospirillales bacterium]